jgi:hypothetical protein
MIGEWNLRSEHARACILPYSDMTDERLPDAVTY